MACRSDLFIQKSGQGKNHRSLPTDPSSQSDPLSLTASMQTFKSCAEAEAYLEDHLVLRMQRTIDSQIRSMTESQNRASVDPANSESDDSVQSDSGQSGAANGPKDYTTTNNQVSGVEEADVVKNDGNHIYHLAAEKLNILQSWPAESMQQLSTYTFKGQMHQILLNGDQVILMGNPDSSEIPVKYLPEGRGQADMIARPNSAWDFTKVIVVDVKDKSAPKTVDTYMLKGRLNGARQVADVIRFILLDYELQPPGVKMWIDWQEADQLSPQQRVAKLNTYKIDNEKIIREYTLADWLHADAFVRGDGQAKTPTLDLQDCSSIHAPNVDTEIGLTRVATLNLKQQSIQQTVLFSYASQIYANASSLYVATPYWWWNRDSRNTDFTYIHKFDISKPDRAEYLGSGGVQGTLLNQFSMDEHEGVLRVATTITERVPDQTQPDLWDAWQTYNRVTTFKLNGDQLALLGQTANLAKDERIFSARFYGSKGFLVTFRQVDPLFTLDLSDPSQPKVVGELKVPGFSNYMQLIDETHILAIGRDATPEGRALGLKLSVFDVSDMTKPVEVHSHTLAGNFWSEAAYDHKAFTYFPARKVLGIPATGFSQTPGSFWWDQYRSSLFLFDIDVATGIAERGTVEMNDIYRENERDWRWWRQVAQINRSIFADDYIYALSNLGIRATTIEHPEAPVATVRYECTEPCLNY